MIMLLTPKTKIYNIQFSISQYTIAYTYPGVCEHVCVHPFTMLHTEEDHCCFKVIYLYYSSIGNCSHLQGITNNVVIAHAILVHTYNYFYHIFFTTLNFHWFIYYTYEDLYLFQSAATQDNYGSWSWPTTANYWWVCNDVFSMRLDMSFTFIVHMFTF